MEKVARWTVPDVWVPDALAQFFPKIGADMAEHRRTLKMDCLVHRDRCCRGCHEPFLGRVAHMHEALITRKDVQGWKLRLRIIIHNPFNCILVCPSCHFCLDGKTLPSREQFLLEQIHLYGLDVLKWLASLPFKPGAHPLKGYIEKFDNLTRT